MTKTYTIETQTPLVTTFNGRSDDVTLTSADVTNVLGFTPIQWLEANNGSAFSTPPIASNTNAIAIGDNAKANSPNTISIGTNTSTNYTNDIAIGSGATANGVGVGAIAIGNLASANFGGTIAIGYPSAVANNNGAIAIGNSQANGVDSIAIGNSNANADYCTAIGFNATNYHVGSCVLSDGGSGSSRAFNGLFIQTTNNTATMLKDLAGITTGNMFGATGSMADVTVSLMAIDTTGVAYVLWNIQFVYNAIAGTLGPQTATLVDSLGTGSTWSYTITLGVSPSTVLIQVTGDPTLVVNWKAKVIVDGF